MATVRPFCSCFAIRIAAFRAVGRFRAGFRLGALLLMSLTIVPASFAQKGTVVRKEIHFKKGSSVARVVGTATWGTAYRYLFSARLDQKAVISLKGDPTFSFRLVVPPEADGEQPGGELVDVRKWSGVLNDTGRYEIVVSQTRNHEHAAPYELTVEIH